MSSPMTSHPFLPSFGNRPHHIIGRTGITKDFLEGLRLPPGHKKRSTILIGQRGTGKTTLLLEFEQLAQQADYVPARVTANDEMMDEIVQAIQANGVQYIPDSRPKIKGVAAGALGFSFGLTFSEAAEAQYGHRFKLSMLCDELAKQDKGVLILVDEVRPNTPEIRSLATTYQHLVGEGKNIAIAMAGLPNSMSAVLSDDILTFLNRAHKIHLQPLPLPEVSIAYSGELLKQSKAIAPSDLSRATEATRGYPYLYQLIGYYLLQYAQDSESVTADMVDNAIHTSKLEMTDSIFHAVLKPLSNKDLDFLKAMSADKEESTIADIEERMQASKALVQRYRGRLIEAGIIASTGTGRLAFTVPFLGEYLRGDF